MTVIKRGPGEGGSLVKRGPGEGGSLVKRGPGEGGSLVKGSLWCRDLCEGGLW